MKEITEASASIGLLLATAVLAIIFTIILCMFKKGEERKERCRKRGKKLAKKDNKNEKSTFTRAKQNEKMETETHTCTCRGAS